MGMAEIGAKGHKMAGNGPPVLRALLQGAGRECVAVIPISELAP